MANPSFVESTPSRRSSTTPSTRQLPRSRTQSISSDRPSTIMSPGLSSPPLSVSPEAAFIAPSAASQIVTNDHDSHADTWYDQHGLEPAGETALVSPAALQLVNNFLDQLLFNFLNISQAVTLSGLRPAVSEVLKPKLAKDAINNADEELKEYLGGADEEDFVPSQGPEDARSWDLELAWKRTRLRCMVYSSLGDMEEEDEDYHTEQGNLEPGPDELDSGVISPAVAIFLTSILEFMGEAALVIAGQAAYQRMQSKFEKELKEGAKSSADIADRIVVQELDMERVALDRTLGRLWRAWKKRVRSPLLEGPRPFSRTSVGHLRQKSSINESLQSAKHAIGEGAPADKKLTDSLLNEDSPEGDRVAEYVRASAIPLPIGDRDVDEIEVPGLISYSDDDGEEDEGEDDRQVSRRRSWIIFSPELIAGLPSPLLARTRNPLGPIGPSRKRSHSLPALTHLPQISPAAKRHKLEQVGNKGAVDGAEASSSSFEEGSGRATDVPDLKRSEAIDGNTSDSPPEIRRRSSKRISRVIGAAAVAGPAVASVAALTGSGSETKTASAPVAEKEATKFQDETDEIDDFGEEPQILTSARVSFAGPSSPPISDSGKEPLVSPNILQRTSSVHSARIIDVVGPKSPMMSPITRSRTPSADGSERGRTASISRTNSLHTPPIVEEERPKRAPIESSVRGRGTVLASHPSAERVPHSGQGANGSISEAEEESVAPKPVQTSSRVAHDTSVTSVDEDLVQEDDALPIFGSATRKPDWSRTEQGPSTKVTILPSSNVSNTVTESKTSSSPRKPAKSQPRASADQSERRPSTVKHAPSGSIGVPSVEPQAPSQESPELRQMTTSGSSGSSAAGKVRTLRASEDNGHRANEKYARNFEQLIQSDETIQYTLTPEHMRDVKPARSAQGSQGVAPKSRKPDDARKMSNDQPHSSSNTTVRRSGSVSQRNGQTATPDSDGHEPTQKATGYVPKAPPVASGNKSKASGPQAREARVPRESMVDFADFIRSTGPPADNGPTPLRSASGGLPPAKNSFESRRVPVPPHISRARLQARDAAVDAREDNSDLIDFIRRGPQSTNPRIPRTVAPFRTTMDSDQLTAAVGGRAVDASLPDIRYSQASTNATDITMPSVQSSTNSQSALLKNRQTDVIDEEDMMPKRTRRRVKDPYAIDFSDEDDELGEPMKPPPKKEESLAEFLRNCEPPPEPTPLVAPPNKPRKKASAPSLIGRFSRGLTSSGSSGNVGSISKRARGMSSTAGTEAPSPVQGAHGHVPLQVNLPAGYDKYDALDNRPPRRPATQSAASSGRVPMKKFEPRDAVPNTNNARTDDLAAFLRDSEPPPDLTAPQPFVTREEQNSSAFSKMFSRRKKSAMA